MILNKTDIYVAKSVFCALDLWPTDFPRSVGENRVWSRKKTETRPGLT